MTTFHLSRAAFDEIVLDRFPHALGIASLEAGDNQIAGVGDGFLGGPELEPGGEVGIQGGADGGAGWTGAIGHGRSSGRHWAMDDDDAHPVASATGAFTLER